MRMRVGLQQAGSALSQGVSLRIDVACDGRACIVTFPDGQAVRAEQWAKRHAEHPGACDGVIPGADRTGFPGAGWCGAYPERYRQYFEHPLSYAVGKGDVVHL